MLRTIFKIAVFLFFTIGTATGSVSSQVSSKRTLRYIDKYQTTTGLFMDQTIPLKANRVSSIKGNIVLLYDEELPDSVKLALGVAKDMWESKLPTKLPVFIQILFEPEDTDVAMISDVMYSESTLGCPSALLSQLSGEPQGSIDSPDGLIIFNSNIDWNCNFTTNIAQEYNITTMALRGIARCLGFGSSIYDAGSDDFHYYFEWPAYFDKLLHNQSFWMSELPQGSSQMKNFVKSNEVVLDTPSSSYKVYSPETYIPYMSLCYLDNNNSIMSYSLGQGNVSLEIDDSTIDILRTLGWDLPFSGFKIVCDNVSENGIGSSYDDHTFSLNRGNNNVSGYNWKFSLKNKSGTYDLISTGTSEYFTISKISSSQDFYVNLNGDLEGRIECDYTTNGASYSAVPFSISLELKPVILSIDNISINRHQYDFSLNFNVEYVGADNVSVEVEEEYNTTLRSYRFDEPFLAHIKTGNITSLFYSWVTIVVTNKYGSAYETLEYAPSYGMNSHSISPATVVNSNIPLIANTWIKLFKIDGTIIYDGPESSFTTENIPSGLYIKRKIVDDNILETVKIVVP